MIACALCVGAAEELYLPAALAAIAPVVDVLVVNDNSGEARSVNRATIEASAFGRDGRLRVFAHRFVDFATMRNDAFAHVRALDPLPDWLLWLDSDEVHPPDLARLASVLPSLSGEIATVDGYTDHFLGSPRWISDTARRLAFYRYAPQTRWVNAVHEKTEGLEGRSLVLPYRYYHYGNVLPPAMYARKDGAYLALGNQVDYRVPSPDEATIENVYGRKGRRARPFHGGHPPAVRPVLAMLEERFGATFAAVDALFAREQTPRDRVRNATMGALEEARIAARLLQPEVRRVWRKSRPS